MVQSVCHPPFAKSREGWGTHCVVCHRMAGPPAKQVSGTLPYMCPEQLRGEVTDQRSDIWSAGAVLYELATGRRPFAFSQVPLLIDAILNKPPEPPSAMNPKISPGLEMAILKCLDKDPEGSSNSVSVIDTTSQTVVNTVPVQSSPTGVAMALTSAGTFAFVTNSGSNSVSMITVGSNPTVNNILVGTKPVWVAVTPNSEFAYVEDAGSNDIKVISVQPPNTVVSTIQLGVSPNSAAFTPDGTFAYVASSAFDLDRRLSFIDGDICWGWIFRSQHVPSIEPKGRSVSGQSCAYF